MKTTIENKLKNLTRGDNSLAEFEGFEPMGRPVTINIGPDWRPCNVNGYQEYLDAIQAVRPVKATAYAEGRYLTNGKHTVSELRYLVPIQFYRELEARK